MKDEKAKETFVGFDLSRDCTCCWGKSCVNHAAYRFVNRSFPAAVGLLINTAKMVTPRYEGCPYKILINLLGQIQREDTKRLLTIQERGAIHKLLELYNYESSCAVVVDEII